MKQINDYTSRHLTALALAVLLVGLLFVPAVSATILYDEEINDYTFTGESYPTGNSSVAWGGAYFNGITFNDITKAQELHYVVVDFIPEEYESSLKEGDTELQYWFTDDVNNKKTLRVSTIKNYNLLGSLTYVKVTLFFDDWDITGKTGTKTVQFNQTVYAHKRFSTIPDQSERIAYPSGSQAIKYNRFVISCGEYTRNHIKIDSGHDGYIITLTRNFGSGSYGSNISVSKNNVVEYYNYGVDDLDLRFLLSDIDAVSLTTTKTTHNYPLRSSTTPTENQVTVYVRNAQSGALIAGTNLNVNLYGTETWYNSTLDWGWDSIQLPAGNYEFYAEKSGFTQYAPGRLTVDGVGGNINLLLYPDVALPPAGNLTLQFWVCDSDLNGIPYAELSVLGLAGEGASFDSGIIQTNNLGYATLTAPGNSTYTAYASKPGYTAGENEFGVTTASPVHITVMLMAGTVPTHTAVTPTITVEPTQTTPPIQEDNIIGLSVKGLAKGFGIDYDTALLLFGLMIVFGAGGIVMNSVKGGAMEFIAGSIVGTFVAFALGLIPIWIFIIIAVVFGAYVLRVFIQGGQ